MTIRYLSISDVERLEELDRKCFPAPVRYNRHALSYYLSQQGSFGLAEFNGNDLEGFIIVTLISDDCANIVTIDIEPALRRRGIGSKLINLAKNFLHSWNIKKIGLQVSIDNTTAIKFYKKHGFRLIKRLPMYYPTTDGYQMELIIG